MPGTERRNSASSEDSTTTPSKQDGSEVIPTRTTKSLAPKPAANPLQFIKVGPCDLYKAAQEQIRKVEEIKKVEKVKKEESEDWQSNLDNWKCSRRKRQEHIIDRVVEVKKLELEEHERNRRRGKTLTEMMEERTQKGVGPRKMSILSYPEDDANDLSELGIGLNEKDSISTDENENNENENNKSHTNGNGASEEQKMGTNGNGVGSSPEPEEYTYERAIQGYKSFAEKKVKAVSRQRISPPKKETGSRIGEKLQELEQVRLRSNSVNDVNLPKVDIHKRRSLFEMVESAETKSPSAERVARDLGGSSIVKERLSSLVQVSEPQVKGTRPQEEISTTIKDRLTSLEKQKTSEPRRVSNGDIGHISIKERLSSLEKHKKGLTDLVNSNTFSDEEGGTKDLLSPAISDREVSSPLVSAGSEIKVEGKVMVVESEVSIEDEKTLTVEGSEVNDGNSVREPAEAEAVIEESLENKVPANTNTDEDGNFEKENEDISHDSQFLETSVLTIVQNVCNATELNDSVDCSEKITQDESEKSLVSPDVPNTSTSGNTEISIKETVILANDEGALSVSHNTVLQTAVDSNEATKISVTKTRRTIIKKPKPKLRVRKLTPILSAPNPVMLSPVKAPGDLAVISEDRPLPPKINSEGLITIDEDEGPKAAPRHTVKGAETSESGIDMEESSLYTDENIDEVLGDDDEDVSPPNECQSNMSPTCSDETNYKDEILRQQEAVTRFDELINLNESESHEDVAEKDIVNNEPEVEREDCADPFQQLIDLSDNFHSTTKSDEKFDQCQTTSIQTIDHSLKVIDNEEISTEPLLLIDTPVENKSQAPIIYENIIIAGQVSSFGEIVSFPLGPTTCVQPPKEKPPPPPIETSDNDEEKPEIPPKTSLRRLDSTKRIKKEIRKKRSDFLGIEGTNDDSFLEPEVDVAPPPDMLTLLQEERKLDQQLYRQSLSSEADSAESSEMRTSAVDRLDKTLFMDKGLFRQSICSETDSNHETAESRDSGVELDRGHVDDLCWAKQSPSPDVLSEPHSRQNSEPYGNLSVTSEEDEISKKEREIIEVLEKEEEWRYGNKLSGTEQTAIGEKLAAKLMQLEQEKMQLEWERAEEEGRRMADEERLQAKEVQLRQQENSSNINKATEPNQENLRSERERLEKEQLELERVRQQLLSQQKQQVQKPRQAKAVRQGPMASNLRYSMPDLQGEPKQTTNNRVQDSWTRVPSADNLLAPQQMTRATLQALSAAPRSRIVDCEAWMQPKRKTDAPKNTYNYQHWLIQEAEHRRITEQQQRVNQSRRSLPSQLRSSTTHASTPHLNNCHQGSPHRLHAPAGHFLNGHQPLNQHPQSSAFNGNHYSTQPSSNPSSQPTHSHSHSLPHTISPPSHHTVGLPPSPHIVHSHPPINNKPLPDSIIQTITQRVQNKLSPKRRLDERLPSGKPPTPDTAHLNGEQERMLSVSGKKKCSHCGDELGRGAAMVIESLRLFYHIDCFKCCVCHTQLGDGLMGTDVRVRNNKLHCHNCYSSDDVEIASKIIVNTNISKESSTEPENSSDDSFNSEDAPFCDNCCYCCCCWKQPEWFQLFMQQYQYNEEVRMSEMRQMHLDFLDIEIAKYELLKSAISCLNVK